MSDAQDAVNDLLAEYESKLTNVAPTSVGIQLGLMAILSVLTILAFSVLRPKNKLIYAPKVKYSSEEKRPPPVDDGLFSWVRPLLKTKEPQMLVEMGLDAVIFLRFLRMCRWLFTSVAIVCCGVLIPINVIYNVQKVPASQRNPLSMLTIVNVSGNLLYAHVAISYIICFIAFWFIWVNYKRVVELKHAYFRSAEYNNSLHSRSIMITGVSRQYQSDEGLQSLLLGLNVPYPTTAVHIGRRVGHLTELVEAHNDAVRELEQVLTTYTKDGKLASKRPTKTIGGFMGCGGQKVDTIDYMTAKIKRLEDQVEGMRDTISDKKSEPYGFASFSAVPYAHVVARKLQKKRVKGCEFSLAPLPADIIWKNLSTYHKSKVGKRFLIALFLTVFCGFYTIPLIAVSALANLTAITQYVGFLNDWQNKSNWSFSAVVGIAPPLLSVILQLLLPVVMRALTRRQGLLTRNQVDRTVLARYFAFLIITQLLIFSMIGVVYNLVTELVIEFGKGGQALSIIFKEVNKLPARIQNTYVNQSNYWLTWLPLRAWGAVFDLAQIVNLIWVWARARLFGRTPREIREWTRPPPFDYAVYIANSLMVVAVAFIYAPLAPLIPLLASLAFFASAMIYKYQLLFVSVTKVESGGRMWRPLVNRMLVCLVFMQAIMVLTIGLQHGWIRSITCVPPVLLVLIFKIVLSRTFDERYTWYMPTDQEVADAIIHHADARKNRLHKRFGNPALHSELFTPMIHKKSQHLLPQIYSGRMADFDYSESYAASNGKISELPSTTAETGGLVFKAVEESEIQQSREAYLREQDAWETGSVSTAANGENTPLYRNDAASDYFEAKKREYLANGPRPMTPSSYDMMGMSGKNGSDSQEDLLYNAAGRGAGPGYAPPPGAGGARYAPAAMASYEDVGLAYGHRATHSQEILQDQYGYGGAIGRQQAPRYQPVAADMPPGAARPLYDPTLSGSPAPSYQYPPSQRDSPPTQYDPRLSSSPQLGRQSPVQNMYAVSNPADYPRQPQYGAPTSRNPQQPQYGHRQGSSNGSAASLQRFYQ